MATHGLWQSLPERVGQHDAMIEALISEVERLREQVANAHEAEEILRRAQAPPPTVPPPRKGHRRERDRTVTYLRVVKVATIGVLAAGVVAGAVIPASSIVAAPARAAQSPFALCDPPGFAPPSSNGLWQLDMTPSGGPCIEIPTAVSGR